MPDLPPATEPRVTAALVPLIAVVIPEWLRTLRRKAQPDQPKPKKVLLLVCGSGQPRDIHANPYDNSTEASAKIAQKFVELCYPDIEVVRILSSASGMFRYDDNVKFVKEQVLPVVEEHRSRVVAQHGESWGKMLNVTLSLSDGAPARISALNASLRAYRPNYLHMWRLKTYWDEDRICEQDVDFHTFNKLEMRPATPRSQISGDERALVEEMLNYRRQFEAVREASIYPVDADDDVGHELASFWLRKTRKAVLAVLLTRKDDKVVFYRGMNVEVSMPTGTLCAERNAIGNALAADQTLKRKDIRAVAVLSITLEPAAVAPRQDEDEQPIEKALNPLDPCGACMEWLRKIAEVNPDFKVVTFTDTNCQSAFITPIDYWQ